MKKENYIVIQGWMVSDLQLKGNELLIYAIIYGFSQDGEARFTGSLNYLAEWTNSTKRGVLKSMKNLLDKGYIFKHEKVINGVKFCEYTAMSQSSPVVNKVPQGSELSSMGGSELSSPNNIYINNINNNIDNNKRNIKEKDEKTKHKHGEYSNVLLTDEEYQKLQEQYSNADELITYLDEYIEMKGYKAKSHYLAIKKWVVNAIEEHKRKNNGYNNRQRVVPVDDFMKQTTDEKNEESRKNLIDDIKEKMKRNEY